MRAVAAAELRPRCGWAVSGLQPSCARIMAKSAPALRLGSARIAVGQRLHRGWTALRWHRPCSSAISVRLAARLRPSTLRQPVKRYEHLTGSSPRRRRARQFPPPIASGGFNAQRVLRSPLVVRDSALAHVRPYPACSAKPFSLSHAFAGGKPSFWCASSCAADFLL